MGVGSFFNSDLYRIYSVIQNTQILYPKELIISTLKEYFAKDTQYHYVKDEWGFPKTPNHTDLPANAGINDDLTTRIYIGQEDRFDVPFYPAVLVKHSGSTFVPLSFNEEKECVQYGSRLFVDGYNRSYNITVPIGFIFAGSWDITLDIDILAESPQDRSTIAEAICILLGSVMRDQLTHQGLFIKGIRTGSESYELYQNDMVFKTSINIDCRGEYRRLVPVDSIIEVINACIDFGPINEPNRIPSPNMEINYSVDILSLIHI